MTVCISVSFCNIYEIFTSGSNVSEGNKQELCCLKGSKQRAHVIRMHAVFSMTSYDLSVDSKTTLVKLEAISLTLVDSDCLPRGRRQHLVFCVALFAVRMRSIGI